MAGRREIGARGLLFGLVLLITLAFVVDMMRSNSVTRDLFASKPQPRTQAIEFLRANRR